MKHGLKKRILSLVLCISMVLPMAAVPMPVYSVENEESIAPLSNPFTPETIITLPDGTTTKSQSYRIPSMVTLADGTIVAAADIRWNTTYDGGGLDTLVARSTDNGKSWSYTVANYLGDNGNVYNGSHSTAFLDPSLLVAADGKTVYMLVDLYPYGVALNGDKDSNNAYVHTQPSTDVGFNDAGYLKLSDNNHTSYDYYLKDGKIYTSNHEEVSGYTVDPYFNITGEDGTDSNLFFENSPFKVVRTGYLYLTKSTNGGETWSVPQLLNVKTTSERVCLVAPGNSITTSNDTMIFPVYSYHGDNAATGNTQRLSFLYSTDGVDWKRTEELNAATAGKLDKNWASEAAVVELQDGTLRFFIRNGSQRLQYVDYTMGSGWGTIVTMDNVKTNSNTQISAITYSRTVNGKKVILVSCPTGPDRNGSNESGAGKRLNGSIFVFTVDSTGKMELANTIEVTKNNNQFMYSCLTERADGSVAILYEDQEHGWGVSGGEGNTYDPSKVTTYYTMDGKIFTADELGVYPDLDEMTKVMLKEGVTQVTLYQNPADSSAGSVSVTADELDGVYLVDGWYIDPTTGEKWYLLKSTYSHAWPSKYNEYRFVPASALEETDQGLAYPIVDFTHPAPIMGTSTVNPAVTPYVARRSMFASPAQTFALTRGVQKDATGLELSKTATDNGNGTYTITLEAYTTGTVTVTQTTKPLDIVLVLDQSGSMEWCINCGAESWSENSACSKAPESYIPVSVTDLNNNGEYYVKSGNTYTRVYYCDGGWFDNHEAGVFYDEHRFGDHSGNAVAEQIYEHTGGKHVRRVDALKEAVQAFVDEVYRKAAGADGQHGTDDDVAHRIAIVGFGSDNSKNTELLSITGTNNTVVGTSTKVGVQYSGNLSAQQYKDVLQNLGKDSYANSKAMLDNAIKVLAASGATRADLGMKMAENIYKNNTVDLNERNRVTIMFTDGTPTSNSNFSETVANSTISSANTQKNTYGATVYTIGVFDGANASNPTGDLPPYNATDSNQENRYMYLVSSNYPNASNMQNTGNRNPNVTATQSYYMSASSTEALNKIFVAMSTQMGGTTSELDSTTVVKDIVAPSFVLPNGAGTNITVTTMDAYYTDGVLGWRNEQSFAAGITITGNTVDVTGFDFKHNFVAATGRVEGDATQSGNFHGRKLVITFVITPNPNFLGGSGVPTNGADSGVYDKDGVLQEDFTIPTVNVPLKPISTVVQNKYIYLGNTADLTGILDLYVTVMHEDQQKNLQIDVDGINNAYVDLKYTITLDNNTVAVYTIPAGKTWAEGIWTENKGELLQNYLASDDTLFAVKCVMSDAAEDSELDPSSTEATGTATVKVFKPTITFRDVTKTPMEGKVNYDGDNYVSVVWLHGTTEATPGTVEGNAPTLTYTYAPDSGCVDGTGLVVTYEEFHVNVTEVLSNGINIIGGVTFEHTNCSGGCGFDSDNGEFMIHLTQVYTSLVIQKAGWEAIDPNQSFLFHVEGEDVDLIVTVHGNGSATINGLKVGSEYTVTELTDWSWRYVYTSYSTSLSHESVTNGAKVVLETDGNEITFTNTREENKWLDGDNWLDNLFKGN